jgi:Outer membrane protein beta-barrel domain
MKKIVLFSGFFLFFAALGLAQEDPKTFRFGVLASPSISWLKTSDKKLERAGSNLGLKIGMQGEYYFQSNYAIFSGIGFGLNQGGTIQNGYPAGIFWNNSELSEPDLKNLEQDDKIHYRINYVEVPFGLKMRGGSNEDARFRYFAEVPVITLGFVSKALGDIRGSNGGNTEDENIREDVNGLALSWGMSAGVEYEVATKTTLVAGISYQQMFTDVTQDDGMVRKTANALELSPEKSKGTIGIVTLKIGVFF